MFGPAIVKYDECSPHSSSSQHIRHCGIPTSNGQLGAPAIIRPMREELKAQTRAAQDEAHATRDLARIECDKLYLPLGDRTSSTA